MTLRLVDLCCCEGGASKGYSRAGFEVFGVDLFEDYNQKRYPFASWRGDMFDFLSRMDGFDVAVVSPPCQRYTQGTVAVDRSRYPDLIGPVREALKAWGGST